MPTAKTASPTGGGPPITAGTTTSGSRSDGQHRDVVLGPAGRDRGGRPRAVGELDLDPVGAVDDVQGGEHGPVRVDDHPAAQAGLDRPAAGALGGPPGRSVVTVTSDGVIVRYAVVASGGTLRSASWACSIPRCTARSTSAAVGGAGAETQTHQSPAASPRRRPPAPRSGSTEGAVGVVPRRRPGGLADRRRPDRSHGLHATPETPKIEVSAG